MTRNSSGCEARQSRPHALIRLLPPGAGATSASSGICVLLQFIGRRSMKSCIPSYATSESPSVLRGMQHTPCNAFWHGRRRTVQRMPLPLLQQLIGIGALGSWAGPGLNLFPVRPSRC